MIKRTIATIIFLLVSAYYGFAQQVCDLRLVPEGNNLCILEHSAFDFSVVKACRGNTVGYRAHSPTAVRYEWDVAGGTYQLSEDGATCYVTWGQGYGGLVSVAAWKSDSSVCTSRIQVVLEDRPTAGIVSTPNYVVNVSRPEEKTLVVCAGDTLSFVDNSTSDGLPITDYYWEYPGGFSEERSISFIARNPGSYDVIHRVYNECGCYDEDTVKLIVNSECPMDLSCFGTACAHNQQTYTLFAPVCSDYLWNVQGGTLVSPQHSPTVVVQWDAPESGFGMLYLDGASCECDCKSRKSIKIPIISDNVAIQGPDTLCIHKQYGFTIPLWGSTHYSWSVTPSTGVSFEENSNRLTLTPNQLGEYIVSVTYACDFLGCGPYTVSKRVYVQPSLSIASTPASDEVCIGTELSFSSNATTSSLWTVKLNDSIIRTEMAPSLTHTFDTTGLFVIQARNDGYCDEAMTVVKVDDNPPAPLTIAGPDTVCPLSSAVYTATPTSPEYYILWEWASNGDTFNVVGNKASISFGSTVEDIHAYQVSRRTGCRSEAASYHVSPFRLAPWPYGDPIRLCQGESVTLSRLWDQFDLGVLYEWEVKPAYALSIQGTHLEAGVTLLANHSDHVPPIVMAILKRTYCDTYRYDTAFVRIGEIDPPAITHGNVCAGQSTYFTLTDTSDANPAETYWYFDNEYGNPHYGLSASRVFHDTLMHTVHLHYVSRLGCRGEAEDTVHPCPPFPRMHIDSSDGNLTVVVVDGDPDDYSYLWMTGDTTRSIQAEPDGYWCIVTDPRCGCSIQFFHTQSDTASQCTPVINAFHIENYCYNFIGIGLNNNPGLNYPITVTLTQNNHNHKYTVSEPDQRIMVPDSGHYSVTVRWNDGDSCHFSTVYGYVQPAIVMQLRNDCRGHLTVNCQLTNGSPIRINASVYEAQPNTLVDSGNWVNRGRISIPDTGWYLVHLEFENPDCFFDTLIHFDTPPTIQSIDVDTTMCEKTAFTFSADATGQGLTYRWDFGDDSWNFGNGIDHVYSDLIFRHVILTVTDRNGCTVSDSVIVNVVNNYLEDASLYQIQNTFNPLCPGDSAVLETSRNTNNLYAWSPCSQFIGYIANVYEAGNYMVDITSIIGQCRKQYGANVPYPNGPFASILCDNDYCMNDEAEFIGDVGSQYSYRWYILTPHFQDSAATANFRYRLVDTGHYQVVLLVSDADGCTSSDTARFYVHPTPPAPTLEFCGNPCITEGPVDICSSEGRKLLWSNGSQGSSTQYFTDGIAGAYYIDTATGCRSTGASILIPEAPDFGGLLTGCYCIKNVLFPAKLSLYSLGCLNTLQWKWHKFDEMIEEGDLPPSPNLLSIPDPGDYQLIVSDYGEGCYAESPILRIETAGCSNSINPNAVPSVRGVVTKMICHQEGCSLKYDITVRICNGTNGTVCVDSLSPASSVTYSVISGLPVTLNPGQCSEVSFSMLYDFSAPGSYTFYIIDGGTAVGSFVVNLSDWADCFTPDTCKVEVTYSLDLDTTLSMPNQSAFFHLVLNLSSPSGNVISVWCDQGQIIDGAFAGGSYSGLLMMDYGLLTQLVVDSGDFCFHFIFCDGDRICVNEFCIPYATLWEICGQAVQGGGAKGVGGAAGSPSGSKGTAFRLVPNPATGSVSVVSMTASTKEDGIRLIEVFSMNGQKVLSKESSNRFDVSRLSNGTYIVKVVTEKNNQEYLRMVKQ